MNVIGDVMFLLIILIWLKENFGIYFLDLRYECFFFNIFIYVIFFVGGLFINYVLWMFFLRDVGFVVWKFCLKVKLYFLYDDLEFIDEKWFNVIKFC